MSTRVLATATVLVAAAGIASIAPVSAQYPACAPLSGSVSACGRLFSFRTSGGSDSLPGNSAAAPFVLRCPYSASQEPVEPLALVGKLGPGAADPDWRVCGTYDVLGDCTVGESTVHFTRGEEQPALKGDTALTMSVSRSARYYPDCPVFPGEPGAEECDGCAAEFTALFVFEDGKGFRDEPVIDAAEETAAPSCASGGGSLTAPRSVRLSLSLPAPPTNDPAYASALNSSPGAEFRVQVGGADLSAAESQATGSWQRNDQAMDVLVYEISSGRLIATQENAQFSAQGTASVTVTVPTELAGAAATSVPLQVVLRSRSTNMQSRASATRTVALRACATGGNNGGGNNGAASSSSTAPPSQGGMEESSTGSAQEPTPTPIEPSSSSSSSTAVPAPSPSSSSTGVSTPPPTQSSSTATAPPTTTPPSSSGGGNDNTGNGDDDDGDLNGPSDGSAISPRTALLSTALASLASLWLFL